MVVVVVVIVVVVVVFARKLIGTIVAEIKDYSSYLFSLFIIN